MPALEASTVYGVDSCVSGTQRMANPRMTTELEWWYDPTPWPDEPDLLADIDVNKYGANITGFSGILRNGDSFTVTTTLELT